MKITDIYVRDPFILTLPEENCYLLFGSDGMTCCGESGHHFDCYRSRDLVDFEDPVPAFLPPEGFWGVRNYWAPEVHFYRGRYYMFATFALAKGNRGTAILVSDRPEGPYEPWSDGPVTPEGWFALDGTLYVDEEGDPWMVFCHEWIQVRDGTVEAMRLTPDLKRAAGAPVTLFHGSDAPWIGPVDKNDTTRSFITDGPFLYHDNGKLMMFWSSAGIIGYTMGVAESATGKITGPWIQHEKPVYDADGGHGMVFHDLNGKRFYVIHTPNSGRKERPLIVPF